MSAPAPVERPAAAAEPTPGVLGDGTSTTGRLGARWRSSRLWIGVVATLVALATFVVLTQPRSDRGLLDPDSATPEGSLAVVRVLADRGVTTRSTVDLGTAVEAARAGTTLLVARSDVLTPDQLDTLAGVGADLVVVTPDAIAAAALAPGLVPAGRVDTEPGDARCQADDALAAGRASAGGQLYEGGPGWRTCYPDPGAPTAEQSTGSYAESEDGGRSTVVLGQVAWLTNDGVVDEGNAALALRALGGRDTLVWYLARPEVVAGSGQQSATDLLPSWVAWVASWLVVVLGVAVLWRARRLGRLVAEPLPVVVRASETTRGRAAMYARARARERAAATLRTAALRRVASRLGAGLDATPDQVVALVSQATGRPGADVAGVLLRGAPSDDAGLIRLADDIDTLERQVRRP